MNLTDEDILAVAREHCEFTPEGTYHLRMYPGRWAIVAVVRECIQRASLAKETGTATGRKDGCEACAAIPASSRSNEKNAASVGGASAQVQVAMTFDQWWLARMRDSWAATLLSFERDKPMPEGWGMAFRAEAWAAWNAARSSLILANQGSADSTRGASNG